VFDHHLALITQRITLKYESKLNYSGSSGAQSL